MVFMACMKARRAHTPRHTPHVLQRIAVCCMLYHTTVATRMVCCTTNTWVDPIVVLQVCRAGQPIVRVPHHTVSFNQ